MQTEAKQDKKTEAPVYLNMAVPCVFMGHHFSGISIAPGVLIVEPEKIDCVVKRQALKLENVFGDQYPKVFIESISSIEDSRNRPMTYCHIEAKKVN